MITEDKVTEIFCMADDFCKFFDAMVAKYTLKPTGKRKYHRDSTMSKAEVMLIMILFHDSGYRCFKHFYLEKVCKHLRHSTAQYDTKPQHHHSFWWGMMQQSYPRHPSFHRTIWHEIAAPSFVLMVDGAAKLSPSSVIPPRNTTRNCSAIIRFAGRWCSKVTPVVRHSTVQYDAKPQHHHSF